MRITAPTSADVAVIGALSIDGLSAGLNAANRSEWGELKRIAADAPTARDGYEEVRRRDPQKEVGRAWLINANIRYWYFVVAFFVGLRLSRTMAELLQVSRGR